MSLLKPIVAFCFCLVVTQFLLPASIFQEPADDSLRDVQLARKSVKQVVDNQNADSQMVAEYPAGSPNQDAVASVDAVANETKGQSLSVSLGKRTLTPFLTTTARLERVADKGMRFLNYDPKIDGELRFVKTKDGDLLVNDFLFEISFDIESQTEPTYLGLGPGELNDDNIYLKFHNGQVYAADLLLGSVDSNDGQTVRITKQGTEVTFLVDPKGDGPNQNDFQLTIPQLGKHVSTFDSKNVYIFFGGSGFFKEVSFTKGTKVYPDLSDVGEDRESIAVQTKEEREAVENVAAHVKLKELVRNSTWKVGNLRVSLLEDGTTGAYFPGGKWEVETNDSVKIYDNTGKYRLTIVFSPGGRSGRATWVAGTKQTVRRIK